MKRSAPFLIDSRSRTVATQGHIPRLPERGANVPPQRLKGASQRRSYHDPKVTL